MHSMRQTISFTIFINKTNVFILFILILFPCTVSPYGSVVVTPSTQTVSRNEDASFNCTAQGGPNNTIVWINGDFYSSSFSLVAPLDVQYIINSLPIVEYGSNLSLISVNGSDGGTYTCVVLNEAGVDNVTVTLQVRPEIITNPESVFTTNGQSVTFQCLADSFPSPQYYWERFNESSNDFYMIPNEKERYLTIDSVTYEDNGRYRCVATAVMDTVRSNEAVLTSECFKFFCFPFLCLFILLLMSCFEIPHNFLFLLFLHVSLFLSTNFLLLSDTFFLFLLYSISCW